MKQVVNQLINKFVTLDNLNENKIYASKSWLGLIHKLQRVQVRMPNTVGYGYCWGIINNTNDFSDVYPSMLDAIKDTFNSGYDVFEFNDCKEFGEWLLTVN